MGCIGSRLNIVRNCTFRGRRSSLRRQHIFAVLNVDDLGRQISPGKLEITETDLVLHVRGKPSLTWPLRCLRRYGFDNDLFSFESGRRCPTGAGIFAFRCSRAQSLFNILQTRIQGNPGATPNTVPSTPITPTTTCSNNPSTPVSSTFVYVNLAENSSNRQNTTNIAPDVTQVTSSQTVPGGLSSLSNLPSSSHSSYKLLESNAHPLYMNVDGPALPSQPSSASRISHQSARLGAYVERSSGSGLQNSYKPTANKDSILYTNVVCSGAPPSFGGHEPAEVNYAELDLKTDNCSTSTNPLLYSSKSRLGNGRSCTDSKLRFKFGKDSPTDTSQVPNKRGLTGAQSLGMSSPPNNHAEQLGYATIDFDRTAALSVVTRSKINLDSFTMGDSRHSRHNHDIFTRRTRHNSTAL